MVCSGWRRLLGAGVGRVVLVKRRGGGWARSASGRFGLGGGLVTNGGHLDIIMYVLKCAAAANRWRWTQCCPVQPPPQLHYVILLYWWSPSTTASEMLTPPHRYPLPGSWKSPVTHLWVPTCQGWCPCTCPAPHTCWISYAVELPAALWAKPRPTKEAAGPTAL